MVIFRNIKLPFDAELGEAFMTALKKAQRLGLKARVEEARIYKKSIDARHRDRAPSFMYSISFPCGEKIKFHKKALDEADATVISDPCEKLKVGSEPLGGRPVIIGMGPCGMFAALELAEYGYRPIVLERGADVEKRREAVERFYRTGVLEDSNIQFGAGGAGTFSDGKLVTRISDPRCARVLKQMHDFGAPEEVIYSAKPHVGTDRLLEVVKHIAARIVSLGGEVRYDSMAEDFEFDAHGVRAVKVGGEYIETPVLVLAPGHSARDTYEKLAARGVMLEAKPFSVGVRVEHLQSRVDESLYGSYAGDPHLPVGEYALSHRLGERAVYSFCMCPGGEVVAAASEDGGVVTNGMSRYARDGKNANAAIAVSVGAGDFGSSLFDGMNFQRRIERAAFAAGGGGYRAPIETVGDFMNSARSGFGEPTKVVPTYMNGNVRVCALDALVPPFIGDMLRVGFNVFSRKMECFGDTDAVLTGFETRTSAPLRILRNADCSAVNFANLYPGGEGAGYAGGITSAAADGLRIAESIITKYAPCGDL